METNNRYTEELWGWMLLLLGVVFPECTALGKNMQCDLNMCQVLKAEAKDSPTGKLKIGLFLAKRSPFPLCLLMVYSLTTHLPDHD